MILEAKMVRSIHPAQILRYLGRQKIYKMNQEITNDDGLSELTYRKMLQDSSDNLEKIRGFLIPANCSLRGRFLLYMNITTDSPLFVPKVPENAIAKKIGYKFTQTGAYDYVGKKNWRRHALLNEGAIRYLISYISKSKSGLDFWAEEIDTDIDYLLITLAILDFPLYKKLKDVKKQFIPGLEIGISKGSLKRLKLNIEATDAEISRIMFALLESTKKFTSINNECGQNIDKLKRLLDIAKQLPDKGPSAIRALESWVEFEESAFSLGPRSAETYFREITSELGKAIPKEIHSHPITEQELTADIIGDALEIARAISERPTKTGIFPDIPHKHVPFPKVAEADFKLPQEGDTFGGKIDDPAAQLNELVRKVIKFINSGKKFPQDLIIEMVNEYWKFDSKSSMIIPRYNSTSLKLPIVRANQIPVKILSILSDSKTNDPVVKKNVSIPKFISRTMEMTNEALKTSDHLKNLFRKVAYAYGVSHFIQGYYNGVKDSDEIIIDKGKLELFLENSLNISFLEASSAREFANLHEFEKIQVFSSLSKDKTESGINAYIITSCYSFICSLYQIIYGLCHPALTENELKNLENAVYWLNQKVLAQGDQLQKDEIASFATINSTPINRYGQILSVTADVDSGKVIVDPIENTLFPDHKRPLQELLKEKEMGTVYDSSDFGPNTDSIPKENTEFDLDFSFVVFNETTRSLGEQKQTELFNRKAERLMSFLGDKSDHFAEISFGSQISYSIPIRISRTLLLQDKLAHMYSNQFEFLEPRVTKDVDIWMLAAYEAHRIIQVLLSSFFVQRRYELISYYIIMETGAVICVLSQNLRSRLDISTKYAYTMYSRHQKEINLIVSLLKHLKELLSGQAKFKLLPEVTEINDIFLPNHTFIQFYHLIKELVVIATANTPVSTGDLFMMSAKIQEYKKAIPFGLEWLQSVSPEYVNVDLQMKENSIVINGRTYYSCYKDPKDLRRGRSQQSFGEIFSLYIYQKAINKGTSILKNLIN